MQFYERSCAWVYETQGNGVEALALQTKDGFLGSIYSVTQDRVANIGHVDADLVGAARLQFAAEVRAAFQGLQHLPMRDRRTTASDDRHFLPVPLASPNGGVDGAGGFFHVAGYDALVGPGQGVVLELGG